MSYLDKTFCASPNCVNDCGRQLTAEQKQELAILSDAGDCSAQVVYGYFCGDPEQVCITDDYALEREKAE